MLKRIVSAALIIPFLFLLIYLHVPMLFGIVTMIASLLLAWEILHFGKAVIPLTHKILVYLFISALFIVKIYLSTFASLSYFNETLPWFIFGIVLFLGGYECLINDFKDTYVRVGLPLLTFMYVGIVFSYLFDLRYLHLITPPDNNSLEPHHNLGAIYIIYSFAIPWMYDAGGYFIGKKWGNKKIGLKASPNKSWAGFYGGLIFASFGHLLFILILPLVFAEAYSFSVFATYPYLTVFFAQVLAIVGQWGDLFESALKRSAKMKDSSQLIAGHGGVFDAIDSVIPTAFVTYGLLLSFMP